MKLSRLFHHLAHARFPEKRPVHLAIGIFDGVHRGHQAVLADVMRAAREDGGVAAALTFTPHPTRALGAPRPTELIMNPAQKMRFLFFYGAGAIIEQPFDEAIATLPAEDFVALLKRYIPNLVSLHVGQNFRFGKGRAGTPALLESTGAKLGVKTRAATPVMNADAPISSTRIRDLLREGHLEKANDLLGHLYACCARVRDGRRLGRTLGFPTLNFDWEAECRPKFGVYYVSLCDPATGAVRSGVANYGARPTVESAAAPQLEVHVLGDDCPWKTGDYVCVCFWKFARGERRFENLDALKAQIARDKNGATAFFKDAR